jgi:hypothetical protein
VNLATQHFGGIKLFDDGVWSPTVNANGFAPWSTTAGLSFTSGRSSSDPSADFTYNTSNDRATGNNLVEWRVNGTLIAYVDNDGAFHAAARQLAAGDFVSLQSDPTHPTLVCGPGATGCYLILAGAMQNTGQHAPLTLANTGPGLSDGGITCGDTSAVCNRFRDGGWMFDVQATGRETHNHHVHVVDDFGNMYTNGTWSSRISEASRQVCRSTLAWDPEMKGLGQVGFFTSPDVLQVCSNASSDLGTGGDGGYETLLTDRKFLPDDQLSVAPSMRHGTATCSGSTKAVTFLAYTTAPHCVATAKASGATVAFTTGPSTGGFTATCSGASTPFDWICIGR